VCLKFQGAKRCKDPDISTDPSTPMVKAGRDRQQMMGRNHSNPKKRFLLLNLK
jgi:hypothetical protein